MSNKTCEYCEISKKFSQEHKQATGFPPAGRVQMSCIGCCVRLVLSTRPDKDKAKVMLSCIARHEDAPSRADVLAAVAERLNG